VAGGSSDNALSSLAEQSYHALESQLVTLALAPGTLVSEGELIDMTGYGRTPVREAIQRLAQHDLFQVIPRKGLLVSPVSRSSLVQILEARRPLERLISYRAAMQASDEQRSSLARIARDLADCHDNFDRFLAKNAEIDRLLDQCCGNPYAIQAVIPLRIHCRRFWNFYRDHLKLSDAIAAHSKLVRLAARRDLKGAQKAADGIIQLLERLVAGLDRLS
jgi:DNA-binding GntR family transcriptional regulator